MRLISAASLPPPQNYLAVQGSRMLLGRAPCDSIQEDQASGPFSRARSSLANLVAFPPSPARSPFPKDKTRPLWTNRSLAAGCTTGSVRPRYPSLRDEVLSLCTEPFMSYTYYESGSK